MSINPFTLLNKTIVVTGASSGIGRQCAITLNQMGAFVILLGRSEERLLETVGNFENENYQIIVTDVTDYEQTAEKLEDALKTVGKVDGIVHVTVLVHIAETDLYRDFVLELEFCVHSNAFKFSPNVHLFFINLLSMVEYFLLLSVRMICR